MLKSGFGLLTHCTYNSNMTAVRHLGFSKIQILMDIRRCGLYIVTDRIAWSVCWSVCLSVGLSVTVVSPAKTTEPIEFLFGLLGRI